MSGSPSPRLVVGVGAQKAGTTTLFGWLGSLPEVSTARSGKEIDYFSRYYDHGHTWYLSHFESGRRVWLDISPNYSLVPDLYSRLETLPIPYRCVLLVRDPVDRAFSQHRHELLARPDVTPARFADALALNPTYVLNGMYGRVLEGLAPLVDQDRLRVVWFDDLVEHPVKTVDDLCRDLGIVSRPDRALLEVPAHVSGRPRSGALHRLRRGTGRVVRRFGGEHTVARFRQSRTVRTVLDANSVPLVIEGRDDPDTHEAVRSMRELFLPDLRRAEAVTGLPFVSRLGGSGG